MEESGEYTRVRVGRHYQEGVRRADGEEIVEGTIQERTLDRVDGGKETFTKKASTELPCGHVDAVAGFCRKHGEACCERCLCSICARGTCRACQVISGGEAFCEPCYHEQMQERHEEQTASLWSQLLTSLGLGVDDDSTQTE